MLGDNAQGLTVKLNHQYALQRVSESSVIIHTQSTVLDKKDAALSYLQVSNALINEFLTKIQKHIPNWLIDYVVAYDSLLIEFDVLQIEFDGLVGWLREVDEAPEEATKKTANHIRLHKLEVCYDYCTASHPNDMSLVAKHCGLAASEIIELHQSISYQVFAIGFMPHFAYLGELPQAICVPRLNEPRLIVPAGAVAIADNQTAVYPNESPGGWHIIGYTHFRFEDGNNSLIKPNDKVSFTSIDLETFDKNIDKLADANV